MISKTAQSGSLKSRLSQGALIAGLAVSVLGTGIYTGAFLPAAFAQTTTGPRSVTITPPTLSFSVKPGDKSEGTLGVINDSNEDILFSVTAYDMIVEDDHGTPEILPPGTINKNKYSASSWIGVDAPQILVKAHTRGDIGYFMQVPADAGPGGHYAAILYRPARIETANGSGAAINTQLATLVYFDVAGPIKESATVKSFTAPGFSEYGPVKLGANITNNGDTHIRPIGKFTVKNMLGKVIASKDIPEGNIFPGGISRLYEQTVGKKWMFGRYTATFMATYGRANNLPLMATVAFWVFPWKIAVLILVLLIAAILGVIYMRKNKHRGGQPQTPSQPVEPTQPQTPQNPQM
jgi:hypothetical protein